MADTSGTMISRAVTSVPEDPQKLRLFIKSVLSEHYQDIKTLFDQCTDNDRFEKLQRDNKAV